MGLNILPKRMSSGHRPPARGHPNIPQDKHQRGLPLHERVCPEHHLALAGYVISGGGVFTWRGVSLRVGSDLPGSGAGQTGSGGGYH